MAKLTAKQALIISKGTPNISNTVNNFVIAWLELGIERACRRGETEISKCTQERPDRVKVLKHFQKLGYTAKVLFDDCPMPTFIISWNKE